MPAQHKNSCFFLLLSILPGRRAAEGSQETDDMGRYTQGQTGTVQLWKESDIVQSSPTLCNPMDCNIPDSSVHGIFQARVLEWAAISFSRGSSRPRSSQPGSPALQTDSLPPEPPGKKYQNIYNWSHGLTPGWEVKEDSLVVNIYPTALISTAPKPKIN